MEVTITEKYTILKDQENNIIDFLLKIESDYNILESLNLILDLSFNNNVNITTLKLFKDFSKKHKKSLVIIANDLDFNKTPNYLTVVPTCVEAIDIIEMEEIERELGF